LVWRINGDVAADCSVLKSEFAMDNDDEDDDEDENV